MMLISKMYVSNSPIWDTFIKNRFSISGGILVAIKNYLYENCKEIKTDNKACLWFLLKKKMFNVDKDILCDAIYLPPEGSMYSDIGMYDDIENDLMLLNPRNLYYTMLAGDFNARTRALHDLSFMIITCFMKAMLI